MYYNTISMAHLRYEFIPGTINGENTGIYRTSCVIKVFQRSNSSELTSKRKIEKSKDLDTEEQAKLWLEARLRKFNEEEAGRKVRALTKRANQLSRLLLYCYFCLWWLVS